MCLPYNPDHRVVSLVTLDVPLPCLRLSIKSPVAGGASVDDALTEALADVVPAGPAISVAVRVCCKPR